MQLGGSLQPRGFGGDPFGVYESLRSYYAAFAENSPDRPAQTRFQCSVSRVRVAEFNTIFSDAPALDEIGWLGTIAASGKFGHIPLTWHIHPATEPHALVEASAWGQPMATETAMVCALGESPVAARKGRADFTVSACREGYDFRRWAAVYAAVFADGEFAFDIGRMASRVGARARSPRTFLLGAEGLIPVSTAAVATVGTDAVLAHIGTLRSHRRRGIGTMMVAAAIRVAQDAGATQVVLSSSQAGATLYQGLGFTPVGRLSSMVLGHQSKEDPC